MKFKDYVNNLNKQLKLHPETGEYDTIYSIDPEGNAFHHVYYDELCIGNYNDGEFIQKEHAEDDPEYYQGRNTTPNSVCIN
tara:strand:+ start:1266 stop:1508 length:243 start_codon:yes stop_codon:yes gene_type:complete